MKNALIHDAPFNVGSECVTMAYGERLKATRIKRGFTQHELADRVGVSESTIRKLEKDSRLTKSHFKIASVLQCDPAWLYSGEKTSFDSGELNYSAPMLNVEQVCILMEDSSITSSSFNSFPVNRASSFPLSQRAFSVRVDSPVNEPDLKLNDIVFIDPDAEVVSGSIVALLVPGESRLELILRRIYLESGSIFIEPVDKDRYSFLCQSVSLVDDVSELIRFDSRSAFLVGVATEKSAPLYY